jgi:hypothetical protein
MVCDFISCPTIFPDVEMLHNNILGAIEKMRFRVDIEDVKERHNAFEMALGFQIPMPSNDSTMVFHIGSNLLIFKHRKSGT